MTDEQIKYMVDRFLTWKLPESFNPDGGVSFKKTINEGSAYAHTFHPVGTNLLDAQQATAMVRHMIEGMPAAKPPCPIDGASYADLRASGGIFEAP